MMRIGLRMTVRAGREGLVRLVVMAAAVAVGVALLLCVLASYDGYRSTTGRACWECTDGQDTDAGATLLWHYGEDYYQGRTIERLDVAALAPDPPVVPGLTRMPGAGQFYVSPALAALLRTVPRDQLGDRFPGAPAGTIGTAGLSSPDELAIVVGRAPHDLAATPDTKRVSRIGTAPRQFSTSQFYRFGFAMGAVALLVPLFVLIGTATRLAAARREERLAALRLIGGTKGQIDVIASVESVVAALAGTVLGLGGYLLLRPAVARVPILDSRFFPATVAVPGWAFPAALAGVPAVATLASLLSLRRVRISPLGVSRHVTPAAPRVWRVLPLAVGLVLFSAPLLATAANGHPQAGLATVSLVVVLLGLMLAGPWLTMRAARGLARLRLGGAALIAARRLADNPRAAFRAVSGLVLAVLVGTALATIVPAAIASQETGTDQALGNVLRAGFSSAQSDPGQSEPGQSEPGQSSPDQGGSARRGLAPAAASTLERQLRGLGDVAVLPIYLPPPGQHRDRLTDIPAVLRCADLGAFPSLGTCTGTVTVDIGVLFTDNLLALNRHLPLATPASPTLTADPATLYVGAVLVKVGDQTTLERARTILTTSTTSSGAVGAPQTFGEVGHVRASLYEQIQQMVTVVAGLTVLIAGCSLAIAVSGGLVERKRPFTLLRLSGTSTGVLYRVVLLETAVPLATATLVAALVGFGLAWPVARTLAPDRHVLVLPGPAYFATVGAGLVLAGAVVAACLPILNRVTRPDTARFE